MRDIADGLEQVDAMRHRVSRFWHEPLGLELPPVPKPLVTQDSRHPNACVAARRGLSIRVAPTIILDGGEHGDKEMWAQAATAAAAGTAGAGANSKQRGHLSLFGAAGLAKVIRAADKPDAELARVAVAEGQQKSTDLTVRCTTERCPPEDVRKVLMWQLEYRRDRPLPPTPHQDIAAASACWTRVVAACASFPCSPHDG